jgi:hypothetical protein
MRTIIAALFPILLLCGCKGNPSGSEPAPPAKPPEKKAAPGAEAPSEEQKPPEVKLAKLDLSSVGLPLTIDAPEGATAKESFGDFVVTSGKNFELIIHPKKEDLAQIKKQVENNMVAKLIRFIVDTPDTLFYEAEGLGRSRFSIEMNVKAGDKEYYIRDGRSPYTKADVELMLKCAKTLAPKK